MATFYDIIVVGGGIIGSALARKLLIRFPLLKLAIVEKESSIAMHQSGNNSGVIHSGIYYTPGSLKAKLCVKGLEAAYKYCDERGIPYKKCGKLIVAVNQEELQRLDALYQKGLENDVKDLSLISGDHIKDIEPNCQGLKAIWSPNTGIVDWSAVSRAFAEDCRKKGASLYLNFSVNKLDLISLTGHPDSYPIAVMGNNNVLYCKYVVTCAGLFSDKLAAMTGCTSEPKIVPFRGEYLLLKPTAQPLVKTNIYPVPDPTLPFLGVHFTPRMDGSIWLGPNAILALKREGYQFSDVSLADTWEIISYRGFQKLAWRHLMYGCRQVYERINMNAQIATLQRYVPSLKKENVIRGPAGVRAQALDNDGNLVDDFIFDSGSGALGERVLHVRNAPSPAATSSLAIADVIADKVQEKFPYISCNL